MRYKLTLVSRKVRNSFIVGCACVYVNAFNKMKLSFFPIFLFIHSTNTLTETAHNYLI